MRHDQLLHAGRCRRDYRGARIRGCGFRRQTIGHGLARHRPSNEQKSSPKYGTRHVEARFKPAPRRPTLPRRASGRSWPGSATQPASAARLVAIGVSTGGPQTLLQILPELPADLPAPVAIVQHMPAKFTTSLARSLDRACRAHGPRGKAQRASAARYVYIAPGGRHLTVHTEPGLATARSPN